MNNCECCAHGFEENEDCFCEAIEDESPTWQDVINHYQAEKMELLGDIESELGFAWPKCSAV